jgi:hypothetical protein
MSDLSGGRQMTAPLRAPAWLTVPAGTRPTECRGRTCRALIYWIEHPRTGKPHPVDCDVPGGEEPSRHSFSTEQGNVFSGEFEKAHDGRGLSHFASCPDAKAFRRGA